MDVGSSTYPDRQVAQAVGWIDEQVAQPGSHKAGYTTELIVTATWPVPDLKVKQALDVQVSQLEYGHATQTPFCR